jgi:2-polyprenyl-3-methyl-5-hydroxy-6-metoxy-1,4-benzoquinol methylase
MSLDQETGRDRYFEARDRELELLVDPETGLLARDLAQEVDCPLCGSGVHSTLFHKQGFTFVRCGSCRLVFVNPQLRESVLLEEYRTAQTADLWFDVLTSERQLELDRAKFAEILDRLEPYRGAGRVLDVGCSIGLFLALARERGWQGLGLDVARRAIAYAREHFGLEILEATLDGAALAPASFDAVVLLSVLEHATAPRSMLAECARVLRPGGALYAIVPNVESLACRALHEGARTFDGRNHLVYFSPSTLADLLDRSGFDVRYLGTRVSSLEPVLQYLAYDQPYGPATTGADPLVRKVRERSGDVETMIEQLDLGYKLHCLATRRD